ncbi:MAG: phosphatidylserine/phosphatidylglycerophosphate/cardiolipin synthase family protein [Candidatus Wallbacteria bacterium]|nr:phosphatidylserine/phosphatidylglycerophosphate/cardiolipin synthase family protein [Candidatus Wallbacteria bacterium]
MSASPRYSLLPVLLACLLGWFVAPALPAQDAIAPVEQVFDTLAAGGRGEQAFVRVLTDNAESWFARWYLLEHATKSIDVSTFIIKDDIFGRALLGLLRQKAHLGLPVRLMIDGRGSGDLARSSAGFAYLKALMREPNVQVRIYRPLPKALLTAPVDVRNAIASNHDKILLVDGEWFITGGRNIATEYFGAGVGGQRVFRDTDVVLRGQVIGQQAKQAFDLEFARWDNRLVADDPDADLADRCLELDVACRAMGDFLLDISTDPSHLPGPRTAPLLSEARQELALQAGLRNAAIGTYDRYQPFYGDRAAPVVLLDKTSRVGGENDITPNLVRLIDAARESLYIQSPYIVLTKTARAALERACARGVQLVTNTNGPINYDHLVTQATFLHEWAGMLRDLPCCRLYVHHGPAMVHAKVFTFDDRVAVVGSYNMDPLSEQINGEAVCVIRYPPFARRNRLRIEKDLELSDEWTNRPAGPGKQATPSGPAPEAVQGALKVLSITGLAELLRPLM